MSRAILIYLTFFISTVFLITPVGPVWTPFLFSSRQIYVETYTYYLFEHLLLIVIFHVIHVESTKYQMFFRYMFWFQVFDMLDYMATYNSVWIDIGVPLSANTLGCLVGGLILAYEYRRPFLT